jgi:dihydrofolate reductase
LKDRTNVAISRASGMAAEGGSIVVSSVEGAIEAVAKTGIPKAFIIGGTPL